MKNNNFTAIDTISTQSFEDLKKRILKRLISEGNLDAIKILIDDNPDLLNQSNTLLEDAALHYAAANGNIEVVRYLIDEKRVVLLVTMTHDTINKATTNGWTALHNAALHGHKDVVEILLAKDGIEVNKANKEGATALHWAAAKGHKDVVNLITYYKKLHNLTAQEPSIDKTIEDSFTFTRENGETETLVTQDIFKKLLLEKHDSASFEKYSNNLQILQTSTNKSSHPQLKDSLEELHKIACEFKTESINKMDDIDLMFLCQESSTGFKMTFSQIKSQHSSLFSVVEILKKLQLGILPLIDSEKISYQEFKKNLSEEDLIIIEDFLSKADKSTPFETIKKYIESKWSITDEVTRLLSFI